MSGERKAKRRHRKRAPPKGQDGAAQEGAARRASSSAFRGRVAIFVAVAVMIPILVLTFLNFHRSDQSDQQLMAPPMASSVAEPRAAIVDHLSLTQPNPAFAEKATQLLEQAGYAVDYYPGEEVTVEFYRHLPTWGHELIVFRVHSAVGVVGGQLADWVTLFTSESYDDTRYRNEQAKWRLSKTYYREDGPQYFSIMPSFIKSSMKGNFREATVIIMGCDGLRSDILPEAFVQRGAASVVGWSGPVSAVHTDAATERLLQHLLSDGVTIQEAVTQTMAEVGPDPAYDSTLVLYPSEEPLAAVP